MRLQVPAKVVRRDQVPVTLLLPGHKELCPEDLPHRLQVRPGGNVQCDQMPSGDVRVVRGQEVVQRVPQGPLLRHADVVDAVPGGALLPGGVVCTTVVPVGQVMPAGVVRAMVMTRQTKRCC